MATTRSEEHTSELQSHVNLVCRLLLEKKNRLFLIIHPREGNLTPTTDRGGSTGLIPGPRTVLLSGNPFCTTRRGRDKTRGRCIRVVGETRRSGMLVIDRRSHGEMKVASSARSAVDARGVFFF